MSSVQRPPLREVKWNPQYIYAHTHTPLSALPLQVPAVHTHTHTHTGSLVYTCIMLNRPDSTLFMQRWLRSADVRILRQLVAVHEGIEAMRWLMEERDALASRGSSLTGSMSSLVTVEEHGPSMSPYRYSAAFSLASAQEPAFTGKKHLYITSDYVDEKLH